VSIILAAASGSACGALATSDFDLVDASASDRPATPNGGGMDSSVRDSAGSVDSGFRESDGGAPETSDPRLLVQVRTIPPFFTGADGTRLPNPLEAQYVSGAPGLVMQPKAVGEIPMELWLKSDDPAIYGEYRFRARVEGQTARWTLGALIPGGQTVGPGNAPRFRVPITSSPVADTSTTSFIVVYAEKFVDGSVQPVLRSFVRVPIVGAQ